jgi:putative oxidoreductase
LTIVALALGALGPGSWSLDDALDLHDLAGGEGLFLTAVLGFGGAAVLLLTCWRPAASD